MAHGDEEPDVDGPDRAILDRLPEDLKELVPLVPTPLKVAEIAETLSLSKRTLERRLRSLYEHLGVQTRPEAVLRIARLLGEVDEEGGA